MGTVCETCGDEGFVEAFVYCDACKIGAVHRYCCGIMPVPIDDYVIWFCSECEGSDTGFECKEVDQVGILTKSEKKKGNKKKKKKISNQTPPVLKVEYHELQDSINVESVEVTSAPPVMETVEEPERREVSGSVRSNELTGLVGKEASVLEAGDGASVSEKSAKEKKKKRKRKSIDHSLPDSTNVEPAEASKKQDDLDTGKSDELTGVVSNEVSVLEKSEKKKKKKKKRNEGSSNHTSPVLEAEGLLDTTNVEATKESKKPKSSDNRESEESSGLVRTEVSVLEKSEMKKKKKKTNREEEKKNGESSNHTSPVLDAEDHGLQDASSAESMKESKKQETTESRNSDELNDLGSNEVSVLEKSKKKKKKKKKKMTNKEEEKKNEESSNHNSPVLVAEDHGLRDASSAESMKEAKKRKTTDSRNSEELNGLASNEVSVLEKSEKKKKKKKMTNKEEEKKNEENCNHTLPVLDAEDHGLRDATSAEPMKESKKQKTSDSRNSDELKGLVRNEVSVLKISEKNREKKKKEKKKTSKEEEKKNEESSSHRSPVLDAGKHGLQDATSAEPINESTTGKTTDSRNSEELNGLASNEVCVVEKSEKKRKKKKKKEKTNKEEEKTNEESSNHASPVLDAEDHGVQDATSAEPLESKKRKTTENRNSDELNGLARKEVSVLENTEKKKTNKEEEKKNEESCTHTSAVLEDHGLQDANSAEPMKESKKQKTSDIRNSVELKDLAANEVSVLEKSEKKKEKKKTDKEEEKKNKESSNHTSPVLDSEDHGLQDATSSEPMKESKKQKTSDIRNFDELNSLVRNEVYVLEKSAKKEEESSNHTLPVLAVEDNGVQDTINVEPAKAQESSASGKPHELVGLAKYAASVSEGGNSSTVPDHNSCTTSRKRRLSSGNIRVTSENTDLATANSSCKEAESNMPQTNGVLTATDPPVLNNDRALPIFKPIWRGSISVKQGSICRIDRLAAHLSSLACLKVHEKASSLQARLSAEMFPRLEIWPESFLKNGPPKDESIALYFFPSRDCKDEKVYYSLVHEMKNDDLAMRCVLDNVELLIFTSYQLPMHCWTFHSKEYLWGIFRRRKTPRH